MSLSSTHLDLLRREAHARVESVAALTQRICAVPAPTGEERTRAEFVAALWRERGYTPEFDELGNVYVRRGSRSNAPLLMLLAHTDTVFPASTPINVRRDGDLLFGPSIGDNSVSVASMLTVFEVLDALGWETAVDIVAVANVGEEGLGNLRGARAAVQRYLPTLGAVLAIDGRLGCIVNGAVGSKRWKVTLRGPGGHSYGLFGTPSAIHGLGRIIAAISTLSVPQEPKTTFNVGMIEGGTSVNTIAAQANAIIDMRSTDVSALDHLAEQVRDIVMRYTGPESGLRAEIEVLGERPAGSRSEADPLVQLAVRALQWVEIEPKLVASSTDANIPISLNIPSACVGITQGEKAHTVDEYIYIPPIEKGVAQLIRLCIDACELITH
ncbi:MAG: M20/M25/M40 family metallo-hydrolase [Ktedonobacteraceae bacterium]